MATADPAAAVALLHEALDTDPAGQETHLACANWFYDHQCWPDAADAYAGYFHFQSAPIYEIRHAESLIGAGHLDEAAEELAHLRAQGLDESDQALVLGKLALTFALKGDLGQGLAFANEASLQKHALSAGAQSCLMMRGTCRYLTGQTAKGIEDMERLYTISSSAEVLELKTRMHNRTFQLDVPQAYPDWYPSKVEIREGPVVQEIPDGHREEVGIGAVSPDGTWRWSGSQWEPIAESETSLPAPVASSPELLPVTESATSRPPSSIVEADTSAANVNSPQEPASTEPVASQAAPPPRYVLSADSNWWWDGSAWKPTGSTDGNWRWNGLSWVEAHGA